MFLLKNLPVSSFRNQQISKRPLILVAESMEFYFLTIFDTFEMLCLTGTLQMGLFASYRKKILYYILYYPNIDSSSSSSSSSPPSNHAFNALMSFISTSCNLISSARKFWAMWFRSADLKMSKHLVSII